MQDRKCVHCGSDQLQPGGIQSTGAIYFRPENAKFLTLQTANIRLHANMCTVCGAVMLIGDTSKAKQLTKPAAPH